MDGETDMSKLTVAFRNFANGPKYSNLQRENYDWTAWRWRWRHCFPWKVN